MSSPSLILSRDQKQVLDAGFFAAFEKTPERYFSAPGRTEIGGNHTDHQRGRVLAAAVNLDTRAAVRVNGTDTVRILSKGYPLCTVSLNTLVPQENEINTTPHFDPVQSFSRLPCFLPSPVQQVVVEEDLLLVHTEWAPAVSVTPRIGTLLTLPFSFTEGVVACPCVPTAQNCT